MSVSIAPTNQISDLVLAMSPEASLGKGKKARPVAVILGLGLALTFAVPQVVEGRAARRRRQGDTAGEPTPRRFVPGVPTPRRFASGEPVARRFVGQDFEPDDSSPAARWRSK